nr:immunoglobulin light chain junction region [Macaca mulatta]MPO12921.1 immunoglobulin light chain junction region [Macaca mulatta]
CDAWDSSGTHVLF